MRRDLYKDTADIQRGAHSWFGRVWVENSWIPPPADDQTEVNCEDYRLLPSVLKTCVLRTWSVGVSCLFVLIDLFGLCFSLGS